jgi:hypothetical protein
MRRWSDYKRIIMSCMESNCAHKRIFSEN